LSRKYFLEWTQSLKGKKMARRQKPRRDSFPTRETRAGAELRDGYLLIKQKVKGNKKQGSYKALIK
jgi:hypothetical protein